MSPPTVLLQMLLFYILLFLFVSVSCASAHTHGNPADELVDILNSNRSVHKLQRLSNNAGLGCMALQYIETYNGTCNESTKPPEVDITEVFAPDCGVELSTVQDIAGNIFGCTDHYVQPQDALSGVLIRDKQSLSLLHQRNVTEVGVGLGQGKGSFYFWCILMSTGLPNSTFQLQGGSALPQKHIHGCSSGTALPCSNAFAAANPPCFCFSILFLLLLLLRASDSAVLNF